MRPAVARLLAYLAENHDRVVSTDELLREVWDGVRVTESSVQQAVHALRSALGEAPEGRALIRTVRGRGYQLGARVEHGAASRSGEARGFPGRSAPVAGVAEAIERARAGRGQIVLLSGPMAAGKTRLLHELSELGPRRGFAFALGRHPKEKGGVVLWAWAEILHGLLDADPGSLGKLAESDRSALCSVFPSLGAGGAEGVALGAGMERYRLFEAVRRWLVAAARTRLLVVAIDDVHRADELGLELLEWVAGRIAGERIVLVAAYRDLSVERDAAVHALLASLSCLPGASSERLRSGGRRKASGALHPPLFPKAFGSVQPPDFVGREPELAELASAWECVREGASRLVLLSGEAGIGKSRLAAEVARRCSEAGAHVLAGRSRDALPAPYQPFLDALAEFVADAGNEGLESRLGQTPSELTRLLPDLVQAMPGAEARIRSDPETERYWLHRAVASWLSALAEERPTLLLLDDLHWARDPTVAMLEHLVAAEPPPGLLILAAHRPLSADAPLAQRIAALRRAASALEIVLEGLSEREVAELVAATESRRDAATLHARTAGNPFFVLELLRSSGERLPLAVQTAVAERAEALGVDAFAVLRAAAVLGPRFDREHAYRVAELDAMRAARALDHAERAGLIASSPNGGRRDAFVHDIVREGLLETIPTRERALLHRRALEALSAEAPRGAQDLADLAGHATAAGDTERAITAHRQLADLYLRSLAFRDAADAYGAALRALGWPDPLEPTELACDLLIGLATAEGLCGRAEHWETARRACALARVLRDPIRTTRAALSIARPDAHGLARSRIAPSWRGEALAFAAAELDETEPLAVRVQAALLAEVGAPDATRSELAARAGELVRRAEQAGDPRVMAEILGYAFYWKGELSEREARLALAERLGGAAVDAADPALHSMATTLRVRALFVCGRVEQADLLIRGAVSVAEETGRPHARGMARHLVANRLRMRGRFAEAAELVAEAHRIQKEGGLTDADITRAFAEFCVLLEHDRIGAHAEAILAFAASAPDLPVVAALRAAALAAAGRRDAARSLLDALVASRFGRDDLADTYLATATGAAIAALGIGHLEAAEALVAAFLPREDAYAFSAFSFTGLLGHHAGALLGMLGRLEEADRALDAAIARYHDADAPLWEARACRDRARVLRALGRSDGAEVRLARRASTLSRQVGVDAVPLWAEPKSPQSSGA